MAKIGYLLPTRENILLGDHGTRSLLDRAEFARHLGYDALWIGDSLLARPRHDPLTLLAAVAAAVPAVTVGTAVLLPMLRNPVVLAHQLATVDQISEGRLVVGAGIAADTPAVRREFRAAGVDFEKRVGTLLEGLRLCRALWTGEAVNWDGRWQVDEGVLAPMPYRDGGPPVWLASSVPQGIVRAAKHFDGWFPIGPNVEKFTENQELFTTSAKDAGRPDGLTTAIYLTVAVDANEQAADTAINRYLEAYYNAPAAVMRGFQSCCGGDLSTVQTFVRRYIEAGADHVVLRLVGDHQAMLPELIDVLKSD